MDLGSSIDFLYWDAFERFQLDSYDLELFKCSLIGFLGEQVQVMGCISLKVVVGLHVNAKTVTMRYLIVEPFKFIISSYYVSPSKS